MCPVEEQVLAVLWDSLLWALNNLQCFCLLGKFCSGQNLRQAALRRSLNSAARYSFSLVLSNGSNYFPGFWLPKPVVLFSCYSFQQAVCSSLPLNVIGIDTDP